MTARTLHELQNIVNEAIEQAHGSPVADQPLRSAGRAVEVAIEVTKHADRTSVYIITNEIDEN